jgi:transglutaminase-like putative cysteine protease
VSADRLPILRASYRVRQRFRYAYPGPIRRLRHRLIVAPPLTYGDQRRIRHALGVTPDLHVAWERDEFGNCTATIDAERIRDAIEFEYEATIDRCGGELPMVAASWLSDPRYRRPSMLTAPSAALREAAAWLAAAGGDAYARAERINEFVANQMRYLAGATAVETTAAQAYAQRTGVCQDYAHVMIALARESGLAARYVCGHLIGEGGTHAWVEVLAPAPDPSRAVVWAFDPTHCRRTNLDYIFVAAGRDFADVTPTSGRFVAPYIGEFTSERAVDLVDIERAVS